jgi:hypothetical protein
LTQGGVNPNSPIYNFLQERGDLSPNTVSAIYKAYTEDTNKRVKIAIEDAQSKPNSSNDDMVNHCCLVLVQCLAKTQLVTAAREARKSDSTLPEFNGSVPGTMLHSQDNQVLLDAIDSERPGLIELLDIINKFLQPEIRRYNGIYHPWLPFKLLPSCVKRAINRSCEELGIPKDSNVARALYGLCTNDDATEKMHAILPFTLQNGGTEGMLANVVQSPVKYSMFCSPPKAAYDICSWTDFPPPLAPTGFVAPASAHAGDTSASDKSPISVPCQLRRSLQRHQHQRNLGQRQSSNRPTNSWRSSLNLRSPRCSRVQREDPLSSQRHLAKRRKMISAAKRLH